MVETGSGGPTWWETHTQVLALEFSVQRRGCDQTTHVCSGDGPSVACTATEAEKHSPRAGEWTLSGLLPHPAGPLGPLGVRRASGSLLWSQAAGRVEVPVLLCVPVRGRVFVLVYVVGVAAAHVPAVGPAVLAVRPSSGVKRGGGSRWGLSWSRAELARLTVLSPSLPSRGCWSRLQALLPKGPRCSPSPSPECSKCHSR